MLNIHATALVVGERGLLISGPSGSGKTTLALALLARFGADGRHAWLVADDRLLVACHGGRLVCRAPAAIAGLVEVPGIGPQAIACVGAAVADLVLRLLPAEAVARIQEPATETIAGCVLPRLDLPARNLAAALPLVAARLAAPPFV